MISTVLYARFYFLYKYFRENIQITVIKLQTVNCIHGEQKKCSERLFSNAFGASNRSASLVRRSWQKDCAQDKHGFAHCVAGNSRVKSIYWSMRFDRVHIFSIIPGCLSFFVCSECHTKDACITETLEAPSRKPEEKTDKERKGGKQPCLVQLDSILKILYLIPNHYSGLFIQVAARLAALIPKMPASDSKGSAPAPAKVPSATKKKSSSATKVRTCMSHDDRMQKKTHSIAIPFRPKLPSANLWRRECNCQY